METKMSKTVLFAGSWRTRSVSDELLRHVSQLSNKKSVVTNINFGPDGLEMSIMDNAGKVRRQKKIALENIMDFIGNKYNATFTLAIVRDQQHNYYSVYVFICRSDKDAAALIVSYKNLKQKLAGEGYNVGFTPNGNNWTFFTNAATNEIQNDDTAEIEEIRSKHSTAQTQQDREVRRQDSESRESIQSSVVQDELQHLANEVRDIKRLLIRQSLGREKIEKHYAYRIAGSEQTTAGAVEQDARATARDQRIHPAYQHSVFDSRKPPDKKQSVQNVSNPTVEYRRVERAIPSIHIRHKTDHTQHVAGVIRIPEREYTKRVNGSKNPAAGRQTKHMQTQVPFNVMTPNWRKTFAQKFKGRPTFSFGGDLVARNIEDVYKTRSLRRVIVLPQQTNPKTPQYENPVNVRLQNPTDHIVVPDFQHVYYKPVEAHKNDNTEYDAVDADVENNFNISTIVNLSAGDDLDIDDNVLMNDEKYTSDSRRRLPSNEKVTYRNGEKVTENNTNVVTILLEKQSDILADSSHEQSLIKEKDSTVHYVRAERLDDFEQRQEIDTFNAEKDHEERKKTTYECLPENNGLFGAYAKHPEQEGNRLIKKTKAVRYHDDSDSTDKDSDGNDEDKRPHFDKGEIQIVRGAIIESEESKSTEKHATRADNPDDDDSSRYLNPVSSSDLKELSTRHNEEINVRYESDDNESANEKVEEYDVDFEVLEAFSKEQNVVIKSSTSREDSNIDQTGESPLPYDIKQQERDGVANDFDEDDDDTDDDDDQENEYGQEHEINMRIQAENDVLF
ncbi:hypothetical protein DPMN_008773 [Dreissena polymorpha]|uniref:Uncharacterized protein n=1 Tax=Dreissena polymorpha TaxID=45954 RepID=A0A9D4N142_DREPO|nr:hypothetical protein DPMN_008773 [Dreissena polymorpha]